MEQNFKDYEYIIVDGSSTDGTIAKARLAGGRNLRVLSEPDRGLYDAMNKGLRLARGKYILFLNAGDAFHSPQTLKSYADAARHNPDIIYGDTVIVDSNRRVLRPRHLQAPDKLTTDSFLRGMLICHQAFMVRKPIAPKFDLAYRFSADYDWCVKCIEKANPESMVNLQQVTIDYLDNGLTEKHKLTSLKERYLIMANHYGKSAAFMAHLSFIPRAIFRKAKRLVGK